MLTMVVWYERTDARFNSSTLKLTFKFLTFLRSVASQPKSQFPQLTHQRDASEREQ